MATPRAANKGCHAPSEPKRAQLAPPKASTTASASMSRCPSGVANTKAPEFDQPSQRCRMQNRTPELRNWCNQARSNGAAFMSVGKTRPELPTKVPIPKASAHSRNCGPSNAANMGCNAFSAQPYRLTKVLKLSECVKFRPPLPASKNLRPTDGMLS